jgi:hypothetical protein
MKSFLPIEFCFEFCWLCGKEETLTTSKLGNSAIYNPYKELEVKCSNCNFDYKILLDNDIVPKIQLYFKKTYVTITTDYDYTKYNLGIRVNLPYAPYSAINASVVDYPYFLSSLYSLEPKDLKFIADKVVDINDKIERIVRLQVFS